MQHFIFRMSTFCFLCLQLVAATSIYAFDGISTSQKQASPPTGHYAIVHGLKMYYTLNGKGPALVLLHGAFSTIEKDFGTLIPFFEKDHLVIGIELQGHGHTSDINRPLSYDSMASDVMELLHQLHISQADFLGYSMGGGVALQIAITHPELLRHLVLASTAYNPAGMNMGNPAGLPKKTQVDLNSSIWKKNYDKVAPDTSHWPILVNKVYSLMGSWKGFLAADISNIKLPVLLLFGDADITKPEHAVEMFRLLGGGAAGDIYQLPNKQLAILPGTTHVSMVDQTDLLVPVISSFLKTPAGI